MMYSVPMVVLALAAAAVVQARPENRDFSVRELLPRPLPFAKPRIGVPLFDLNPNYKPVKRNIDDAIFERALNLGGLISRDQELELIARHGHRHHKGRHSHHRGGIHPQHRGSIHSHHRGGHRSHHGSVRPLHKGFRQHRQRAHHHHSHANNNVQDKDSRSLGLYELD
ncbi:hypothetical protein BXZ70DRAFT_181052 [Cristinia sonorae]|uniref:Uncharacterized protein n=1 Tax=Cristinia sonorae TaxID=1940300 RepID=A0A8K0UNY9_9AGAR|nr:hypothetical protein BXZ70DRAFT_181052 [Cristinia sonorae]